MNRIARAIRDGRAAHDADREAIKARLGWWDDLILCVAEGLVVILWCFTIQDVELR